VSYVNQGTHRGTDAYRELQSIEAFGASKIEGGTGRLKPLPACKVCGGAGIDGMDSDRECGRCGGTGEDPKPTDLPKAILSETTVDDEAWWAA
jgi:DnaJ-class molecular chaperone